MASTWDESLETGNELIDRQHREVVGLLDELASIETGTESEVLHVLDRLMDFTLTHFAAEEALMTEVRYPELLTEEMCLQHREFTDYARLRVLEFRTGEMISVLPLHKFLDKWLKTHEFDLDRLLANWIRQRNGRSAAST
ncbi:MAG: hemerythrin domain-containing protein [Coriobacteriia bacterium]|nr:hemerythrin domain-containing protein [Coriobacteriia bacterium]